MLVRVSVCHPRPRAVQTAFDADATSQPADAAPHASAIHTDTHEATRSWPKLNQKMKRHPIIRFFSALLNKETELNQPERQTGSSAVRLSHMTHACSCPVWAPEQEQLGPSLLTSGWLMQIDVYVCPLGNNPFLTSP